MMAARLPACLALAILISGLTFLIPQHVSAAEPAEVALSMTEAEDGALLLQAVVTDQENTPVGGVSVRFGYRVDFFGQRTVPIGSASTDVVGRASILYQPTWNGPQEIVARAGSAGGSVTTASLTAIVSGVSPALPAEREVLPTVRAWATPVAALVVALVWLTLAVIFLSAVIGIARAGRAATHAASTSHQVAAPVTPKSLKEG
jgi:hypothetical protein